MAAGKADSGDPSVVLLFYSPDHLRDLPKHQTSTSWLEVIDMLNSTRGRPVMSYIHGEEQKTVEPLELPPHCWLWPEP